MTSLIFNSVVDQIVRGAIDFADDDFSVMLCSSAYRPDRHHASKTEVTGEITGDGYDAGGAPVDVTVVPDTKDDCINVVLGGASWNYATIKARYAVYCRKDGKLIAAIDFEKDVMSINGTFSLSNSMLRFQS